MKSLGGIYAALSHRNYAIYWVGMFVSITGSFIYFTAVGWLAWKLTGSAAWVGTVVLVETVPSIIVAPFAGAVIDRKGCIPVMKICQLAAVVTLGIFAAITIMGRINIELVLFFSFIQGLNASFNFPAHFALVAKLVPREDLSPAVALQSSSVQLARFLGPALAGLLLVTLGPGWAFASNSFSYMLLWVALYFIHIEEKRSPMVGPREILEEVADGLRYVFRSLPVRLLLLVAVAAGFLLRPIIELMPVYVGDILEGGPVELAWLLSASGLGALFASLWIAWRGKTTGLARVMFLNLALAAIAVGAFAVQSHFAVAVILIMVFSFCTSAMAVTNQSLIQNFTDEAMRARVMALFGLTARAVPAFGAFIVGLFADAFNLPAAVFGGAVLGVVFWYWVRGAAKKSNFQAEVERQTSG